MSAAAAAVSPGASPVVPSGRDPGWDEIAHRAPRLAGTVKDYLGELSDHVSSASVIAAEVALRQFAGRVVTFDPAIDSVAAIGPGHIEDYRTWLAGRPGRRPGATLSPLTVAQRLGLVAKFFERIAAWGYADMPAGVAVKQRGPSTAADRGGVAAHADRLTAAKAAIMAGPNGYAPAAVLGRPEVTWEELAETAPEMTATMSAYVDQIAVSSRPATVVAAAAALRLFARHVVTTDGDCRCVATVERRHIESYKLALAARRGSRPGTRLSPTTIRHQLGMLRTFFERLIEWGHPDAPRRVPIFAGDLPERDEPQPRFLDDPTAAKFMAAVSADANRRRRLMIELLARTGMRSGELSGLADDAMIQIGATFWLRVPVGKLHNDRHVPLHPILVDLIGDYRAWRGPSRSGRLVERDDGRPFDRRTIARYVDTVARRAGIGHVHPHQLRHTLATQAINRGMSLEAIAALLGHRSMRMTMTYARISDKTVAEQYFKVTQAVEDRYGHTDTTTTPDKQVASVDGDAARAHRRLLGNGNCTRPLALDCQFESICERCGFFETGPQFVTILRRQRDDADKRGDNRRTQIFDGLLENIDNENTDESFT